MTGHILYKSKFGRTAIPFQEAEIITPSDFTADAAFGVQHRNDDGVMRGSEINNTNHTASVHYPHLTTDSIRFSFIKCNIVVSMGHTVVYHAGLENIITSQCFPLDLFYATAVFRRFGQSFTDTLQLQFQFHIFLYQFIVNGLQMKISGNIVGHIIHSSRYPISRCKERASLITVETE